MKRILVVDDEPSMREMLGIMLRKEGFEVLAAESRSQAATLLGQGPVEMIITDVKLPDGDGLEILRHVKAASPETVVIVMTAFGSHEMNVAAMRLGADAYLTKPFDVEELKLVARRVIDRRKLEEENLLLKAEFHSRHALGSIIGVSSSMAAVFGMIRSVAGTNSTVLITGESGTGKELVAKAIHTLSPRRDAPFVSINCGALTETLLESELFGHVRGAFTGAHASKRGLFEKADGGTLFLDEIGDMGLVLQGKLLRVLQDREIRAVGGTQSVRVDVRIIAATNRDLEAEIAAGRFREDLFYRLNVIPIHIPPLRERPDDVPALVEAFLRRHADGRRRFFAPEALERLLAHSWRGNARELENVIERALALSDAETLGPEDVPLPGGVTPEKPRGEDFLAGAAAHGMTLHALSERYTEQVLHSTGGNKVQAARILGIDRKTLYRRAEREARTAAPKQEA